LISFKKLNKCVTYSIGIQLDIPREIELEIIKEAKKITVALRAQECCEYCFSQYRYSPDPFSIEHIIPIPTGGSNDLDNLAFACQGCNSRKYIHTKHGFLSKIMSCKMGEYFKYVYENLILTKISLIMQDRRHFLQRLLGVGASMSLFSFSWKETPNDTYRGTAASLPLILCSRGAGWGEKVLTPAWERLADTESILDAVEAGANVVELDPEDTSVGYGGLPNEEGIVSLDASIMYGPTHNCGSVAGIEHIKTPCSVARLVMERTDHMMLVGEGALRFAKAHGFKEEDLLTDRSRKIWLRWKENLSDQDDWFPPADGDYELDNRPGGTINVLGIDKNGDVAGITTTSGLFGKIPGRIGDSPIIGAGLYLDNAVGAAGATGRGEEVIRTCGSFLLVEKMRDGLTPQEACEFVCKRIIDINGGADKVDFNDKFVAINVDGEVGCASIRGSADYKPQAAYYSDAGFEVLEGTYMIEQ